MLGITAHHLDEGLNIKSVLIGLKLMFGAYDRASIAEILLATMREFKTVDRIGYFTADSATNNDSALHELAKEIGIRPLEQRIRFNAHVMNLATKAVGALCNGQRLSDGRHHVCL